VQRSLPTCQDPATAQHVAQRHAAPHGGGGAGRAPVEADGLLDHVLLLAAVTGADERGGKLAVGKLAHEAVHGEPGWALDKTGYFDGPVFPVGLGNWTVVADVVEWDWGDEAVVHEALQGGLRVEGVLPCEADHGGVPCDPLIRRSLVARVHN